MPTETLLPRQLGFAMPAEWEPHAATWTAWPFDDKEWRGYLEGARREYAAFLRRLAELEPVHLLVHDHEAESDARNRLGTVGITFHRVPLDDVWFRDNGPLFVTRAAGAVTAPARPASRSPEPRAVRTNDRAAKARSDREVALTRWRFNAWGEKYDYALDAQAAGAVARALGAPTFEAPYVMEGGSLEVNGQGLALTTRQCLLHPRRNPGVSQAELEAALRDYLGIERVLWLERGLEGDHTDGHIDTIARFVAPDQVVCCVAQDPEDPNREAMAENLTILRRAGLHVLELPLPRERREVLGERLPLTYANFYVTSQVVLMPVYGDPADAEAAEVLLAAFPGRGVEGFAASHIITSGGAFHCLTQQQPAGTLWKGPES